MIGPQSTVHSPQFKLKFVACGLTALLSTGCVYRSLTIRTEPPGAMVYVNDSLKGTSPVTYDFTWYGWHRVMVRKEGYERVEGRKLIRCPIYLWIPLDLVMELVPLRIKDARTWSYTLRPSANLPTPAPPPTTPAPAPTAAPSAPPARADQSSSGPKTEPQAKETGEQPTTSEAIDATR